MTLPTTINDIEDLYRILEAQPHWRESLRRLLLTAEILNMPQQLTQLAETTAENSRQIAQLSIKVDQLTETVTENSRQIAENSSQIAENSRLIAQLSIKVDQLTETVAENSRQIAELRRVAENHTARMTRIEDDTSALKNMATEGNPAELSWIIAAELDWQHPALLDKADLTQLVHNYDLPKDVRTRFIRADLAFRAQDQEGADCYCATEISWTVNQWDIDRARRNAELLAQTTGYSVQAVAYGQRYERDLNWGQVLWVPQER